MKTTKASNLRITEADRVDVISLVDSSIDFLSTVSNKHVQPFRQWIRDRYTSEWISTHTKLPLAEHGFSMLIRIFNQGQSESILFDTGGSPEAIIENAKRMGISLSEVSCIVLSHGHYDHSGGLSSVIKAVGKAGLPIIVHEDMFRARGTAYSDGTIRKYAEFPTKAQLSPAQVIFTKEPFLIADGNVCVTGEIPRTTSFETGLMNHKSFVKGSWQPDPLIMDDRAVVMNVRGKGLVILAGCAHAGIINTIKYARQISGVEKVYAVMGGFHLAGKDFEDKIQPSIKELACINPELIVPSHCTGWRAMFAMSQTLPDAFAWNSVGNLYQL